jgi:hypothetical protein
MAVDAGPAGQVEQAVEAEPQGGVADHVVGGAEGVGVDVDQLHPQALGFGHAECRGPAVTLGHGRRQPGGVGAGDEGGDARDQASGTPLGYRLATVVEAERQRPPVGQDDNGSIGHGTDGP